MDNLKIAICEDDIEEYDKLIELMKQCGASYRAEHFKNANSFLDKYYEAKYDLILMDIYMGGMNGVEAVSKIRETDKQTTIAFLTSSPDHAMDGYRYHVNRYLMKPVGMQDLCETLELARMQKTHIPSVSVPTRGVEISLPVNTIRYIEQSNHSIIIYLTGGAIQKSSMKLSDFANMLPSPQFYQCHKSYIVNLQYVKFIDKELSVFAMNEGGNAYIRRGNYKEAETVYKNYMFELARRQVNG